ncbi:MULTISPECIES: hypothetical protein [Clostridium]|nr:MULTISPECIES: hypothetical protein [Clostridium]AGY77292.1 hypothetical protein CAETHG_3089 [Clostridium autoethanogenum DSM 10061]ALU37434.1 hypothetical protein CLAU_3007 [Clostridium autoethanogenum DSM 10061]OAA86256.1 carbamoyl phosphate synthase-like protein [Clostridium ljungdahlii DSM 13528]OVY49081.1 carbamoyl phosphate synthase-like protein [Clostridium autoethanogenum]
MKILITDIGDRVQLIKYLKNSCIVIGTDYVDNMSPATAFVNKFYSISKINNINYIDFLLDICKRESIKFRFMKRNFILYVIIDKNLLMLV